MSGRDTEVFHAPALVAQAVVAVSLLITVLGVIALYFDIFLALSLVPWKVSGALALAGLIGVCVSVWSMMRPHPVLAVGRKCIDWRLPGAVAGQIVWDRIESYGLHPAGEFTRMGGTVPREKTGERFIAISVRSETGTHILAAFEMDIAPGLDEVIAAMRRHRPDLERSG